MSRSAPQKGTLVKRPDMTPEELGKILVEERKKGTLWKDLSYRWQYGISRLQQLESQAKKSP